MSAAAAASASGDSQAASSAASSASSAPSPSPLRPSYFECQSWSRCALHVLNNLLQTAAFTPAQLDAICKQLSPDAFINPHKSIWGVGNYDVNVLMRALQTKGLSVSWFDRRKPLTLANVRADDVTGLVVNVPSTSFAAFGARHWLALRPGPDGHWWRLDSNDKRGPQLVPDLEAELARLLPSSDSRSQLLLVLPEAPASATPKMVAAPTARIADAKKGEGGADAAAATRE